MRIGLDIDGVMYQWDRTANYMLRDVLPNSPYGRDVLDGESPTWNFIQEHISKEHWDWLWTEGVRLGLFRHGHLYPGTIQAVRELATLGEVIIITHRPKQAVKDTLAWLTYQDLPLSGVHLLTNGEQKSQVRPECDIYLDDKVENCEDYIENTEGRVVLMGRPWNGACSWKNLVVSGKRFNAVTSWQQFIKIVREL